MIEANLKRCKVCDQIKKRIQMGTYDGKNKKWVDESGKLWNGLMCPICHKGKAKSVMQKLRQEEKNAPEETKI